MLANTIFEGALNQILDVAKRFSAILQVAGIPCRVVGGLAVFLHVDRVNPLASRLTRDVDVAIERRDLEAIKAAVELHGFTYSHVAGVDMFLVTESPTVRSAVHVLFVGERVHREDIEGVPSSEPVLCQRGFFIAPVSDLIHMKLTSFRLKDKVHIQDMDSVGLITPDIEAGLSEPLRARLVEVRATK